MHLKLFQCLFSGHMGLVPITAKCFSTHSAGGPPQLAQPRKEVQREEGHGGGAVGHSGAETWEWCGAREHTSGGNHLKDRTSISNRRFRTGHSHVFWLHLPVIARLFTMLTSIHIVSTLNKWRIDEQILGGKFTDPRSLQQVATGPGNAVSPALTTQNKTHQFSLIG